MTKRKKKAPTGIVRAVAAAGSQAALAAELGCTQQAVSLMLKQGFVPPARAREIENLYGIPRADLLSKKLRNMIDTGMDDSPRASQADCWHEFGKDGVCLHCGKKKPKGGQ